MVSADYDKSSMSQIIRTICQQVNTLSEGKITARYQSQVSAPSSVPAAVGDLVWDSNATVQGTAGSQFVRYAWICVAGSPTAPTFVELRSLTGT